MRPRNHPGEDQPARRLVARRLFWLEQVDPKWEFNKEFWEIMEAQRYENYSATNLKFSKKRSSW